MKNNKFYENIYIFSCIIFLFLSLCFLSFTSHAEEPTFDNKLPFQYQLTATYNAQWNETIFSFFENSNLPINDEDYVLIYRDWSSYGFDGNYYNCIYYFYLVPIGNFNAVQNYNSFDFSTTPIAYSTIPNKPLYNVSVIVAYYRSGNIDQIYTGRVYSSSTTMPSGFQQTLFGHAPTTTTINNGYSFTSTSMCPVYFTRRHYSQSQQLILAVGSGSDIESSAIAPDFEHYLPTGNGVITPSSIPPQVTINNYSWTTYTSPNIDTSTVESLLESLIYVINYLAGWLASNLSGEFANLIDNIEALINYVVETLQYYLGLIIDNIQNGIQNLYDNIVAVIEPMLQKLEYLSEPVDGTIIYDNISGTSIIQNITTIDSSLTSFQETFTGLSEPNSFVIPIHLENLPSSWFGTQTTQYLDFSWINSDMRTLIRGFMWALVTFGLVVTIFDSIANYINGGGDES